MTDARSLVRVTWGPDVAVVRGPTRLLVRLDRELADDELWSALEAVPGHIGPTAAAEAPVFASASALAFAHDAGAGLIHIAARRDGRVTIVLTDGSVEVVGETAGVSFERDRVVSIELGVESSTTRDGSSLPESGPGRVVRLEGGVSPAQSVSWTIGQELDPAGEGEPAESAGNVGTSMDDGVTRVRPVDDRATPTAPAAAGTRDQPPGVDQRPAVTARPTGLIDGIPDLSSPTAPPVSAPDPIAAPTPVHSSTAAPPITPADDEVTRVRPADDESTNLRRSEAASNGPSLEPLASAPLVGDAPPRVQALLCVRRHPNPTHSMRCGVCGDALGEIPESIVRPSLGVLRFSDGQLVPLDRPIVIGRDPDVLADVSGERPRRIALPDAQSVSATHVLLRLEGWNVYIEDLGSSNGTQVTLPERDPVAIRPGQQLLLEAGSQVDLADDATFLFTPQDAVS